VHRIITAGLLIACTIPAVAQSADAERREVLAVVQRLFDAMRAGDAEAARALFHPDARLTTATVRDGQPTVRVEPIDGFIKAIGTPRQEVWDERVFNEVVQIDGTVASVWAEYSFFRGATFSHCGIDAFQLAKSGDRWQIVAIADTRRREGCRDARPGPLS
jgi:hypothetical protein